MLGATPPLPQYAFMAWCSVEAQGQLYIYLLHLQVFYTSMCRVPSLNPGQGTGYADGGFPWIVELLMCRQTDRQTDRHTDRKWIVFIYCLFDTSYLIWLPWTLGSIWIACAIWKLVLFSDTLRIIPLRRAEIFESNAAQQRLTKFSSLYKPPFIKMQ
jgi:hypothetical protein